MNFMKKNLSNFFVELISFSRKKKKKSYLCMYFAGFASFRRQ